MGTSRILAILVKALTAIALIGSPVTAAAQTEDVPEAPPTYHLIPLQFATVGLRATFPDGGGEIGQGLIVARKEGALLVATAGHVVVDDAGDPAAEVEVTLLIDETGATAVTAGRVLPPGKLGADVAFVEISPSWTQPLPAAGLAGGPAQAGDLLWPLPARPRTWTARPGRLSERHAATLLFEGPVASGDSGAPLISYGGVEGLTLQAVGTGGEAVAIDEVKRLFDAHFATSWDWAMRPLPPLQRVGWVRLRRADSLSERFIANILLRNERNQVPLFPDKYMQIPIGTYSVVVDQTRTRRADISCDVVSHSVQAYVKQDLNLVCRADPTGEWSLPDGRVIRISRPGGPRYAVALYSAAGQLLGNGHAQVRDDRYLTIDGRDSENGVWAVEAQLSTGTAEGKIKLLERRAEVPFLMVRK